MIKRPWQIWTIYALCVLLFAPAMLWLSATTWQLDRAREEQRQETELARRQAELQERTSSALWRMDWLMIPLVAQEAARPHYMYESFVSAPAAGATSVDGAIPALQPSPLLTQPSDFILLHFQIEPDGQFRSPQDPQGIWRQQAITACRVPEATLAFNSTRLDQLRDTCSYETLSLACPTTKLPAVSQLQFPWQASEIGGQVAKSAAEPQQQFLANSADFAQAQMAEQAEQAEEDAQRQSKSWLGDNAISQLQQSRNADRGNREFLQRDKATQAYAKGQQSLYVVPGDAGKDLMPLVSEGVMRPFWVDRMLILARRVDLGDRTVIQGCWLDWDKIESTLLTEVADVLPGVGLQPLTDGQPSTPGRQMATLPVQLSGVEQCLAAIALPADLVPTASTLSGLKLSLAVAWIGLILGLIAIALLLHGVIKLSERRAAFASAVTHELRTPLTTFRMYAEMLAEQMVPSPDKQRQYARTMKTEADRLGHLVENVLRYARLERRNVVTRTVSTSIGGLFDRFEQRLHERASQAGMELALDLDSDLRAMALETDPGTVEQIVFNLVDNACKYAATTQKKTIHVSVSQSSIGLTITVRDHGPGIDAKTARRLFRAFSKSDQDAAETAQGVGLGLALCRRMARDLGGRLEWDKSYTDGASFTLTIPCDTSRATR